MKIWLSTLLLLLFVTTKAFGWSHAISLGYNPSSMESNQSYKHDGFFMNGTLYRFEKIDSMLVFMIDASAGHWTASTKKNKSLNTLSISAAFRAYFSAPEEKQFRPYLLVSYGPAYLSKKKFGYNEQGESFALQGTLGAGFEFGKNYKGIDCNLRLVHFSNAGMSAPNQGFNFLYTVSLGFLF